MSTETNFVRLIDKAPLVTCAPCSVEKTMRTLTPAPEADRFSATYRCPKCGSDTEREFAVRP
jgi:predicted RNA-binding Zn-ribbon protein involved in translation (DUF1610 family)